MQTRYPSDDFGIQATGKCILIALGLAVVVAIILMAAMRDDPMRKGVSTSANVPNATAPQPLENFEMAFVEHKAEAPRRAVAKTLEPQRASQISPVLDDAAQAELQQSVQKSINASLTKLGDDLARSPGN